MDPISISKTRDYFIREEKPFFYSADTVWSTFTNVRLEEWEEYLEYRKMQGFNALQINSLPQWDRSLGDMHSDPFRKNQDGTWDFFTPNEAYFKKAQQMVAMAAEKGFIPAIVLLWCNYVEGTWGAQKVPGNHIPLDAVRPYVEYVCQVFAEYQPIFLVSGDTDLTSQQALETYLTALKTVKACCPTALTTFHLNPPTDLPEEIVNTPELDFYMYQSGHHAEQQSNSYILAHRFCSKSIKRPVVNGEPCYEGLQFWNTYSKVTPFHVRKAVWQSLLSGAKAGVTYGAHGIWSWHDQKRSFAGKKVWDEPYSWRTALRFGGAWDVTFAKWLFETYHLFDIEPQQENLSNDSQEIRLASSPDNKKVVIYVPFNTEVRLKIDLTTYDCMSFNLSERLVATPDIGVTHDGSVIKMYPFNSDILVVGICN